MVKAEPYQWQAPGNGRLFDSSLEDWENNLMSQRSIGVLQFLEENPLIEKEEFEAEIAPYLDEHYGHDPNESNKGHFFRSAEFVGLLRNLDGLLSLSIDGKNFLNSMLEGDYESALESYVLQLLKTTYPNNATKDNKLSLFPFRILFKLLSRNKTFYNGIIPKKMFYTDIPFITNINDVYLVMKRLGDEDYLDFLKNNSLDEINDKCPNYYPKWTNWVMSSLDQLNIVDITGKRGNQYITLASPINEFIEDIVDEIPFEDMFFNNDKQFEDVKNNIRCRPRDQSIIYEVIKENNFKCFINENHETFPSNNRPNYVEGHHVIPISWQDSFDKELDCKENVIALCPNCHKAIHYANNEYKTKLLKYIAENNENLQEFGITLEDLKEMYLNKEVPAK